jgi:2,3-bisphosphoglycerate-dependent phosphoglycerate mutase
MRGEGMGELAWLGALRHGESEGNIAALRAEASGAEVVDLDLPDAEVPLTAGGRAQAGAIGGWLAALPRADRPDVVVSSPYRRAEETARIAVARSGLRLVVDERLRDRELGVLDQLTGRGVAARAPEEDARRRRLGRFYYRPPGGESWADVALRVRAVLGDLRQGYPDGRVLLVAHEAVILLLRYLVEGLPLAELVELAAGTRLDNGSLTAWRRGNVGDGGQLELVCCNDTSHLAVPPGPPGPGGTGATQ